MGALSAIRGRCRLRRCVAVDVLVEAAVARARVPAPGRAIGQQVSALEDVVDGVLKVKVMAPAVEGAANASLIRILADELGIARRDVRIVAGAASRQKLVVVDGVEPEAVVARWPGLRV